MVGSGATPTNSRLHRTSTCTILGGFSNLLVPRLLDNPLGGPATRLSRRWASTWASTKFDHDHPDVKKPAVNGLFLDHKLNGPVLLQLRDLFPQTDHFPFEVWGPALEPGSRSCRPLLATWPNFLGLRKAPTASVAFSQEPWNLPLLLAGPDDLHAPRTRRIGSLGLPDLELSPVLGLVGEVTRVADFAF